jgi:hypothetical protein
MLPALSWLLPVMMCVLDFSADLQLRQRDTLRNGYATIVILCCLILELFALSVVSSTVWSGNPSKLQTRVGYAKERFVIILITLEYEQVYRMKV